MLERLPVFTEAKVGVGNNMEKSRLELLWIIDWSFICRAGTESQEGG